MHLRSSLEIPSAIHGLEGRPQHVYRYELVYLILYSFSRLLTLHNKVNNMIVTNVRQKNTETHCTIRGADYRFIDKRALLPLSSARIHSAVAVVHIELLILSTKRCRRVPELTAVLPPGGSHGNR